MHSSSYTERRANPTDAFLRSRVLLSMILDDPSRRTSIAGLKGEDAQCVIDYLDRILRERHGFLATEEGLSTLSLLYALAQSAQLFPQCYELKGIHQDDFQLIVSGALSDIFRGRYKGQPICLKVARYLKDDGLPSIAAKEFVMWAHLSHQNILPFYGVCFLGKLQSLCLVSPWIKNNNVVEYLSRFPGIPRTFFLSDVASGLLYLHQLMIVHGNLIPSNILVSDDGRALIAGFALSSIAAGDENANGLVEDTLSWLAPELLDDYEDDILSPTRESDIWSFGRLCYEILTLCGPYPLSTAGTSPGKGREIPSYIQGRESAEDRIWGLVEMCQDYNPRNRPTCEDVWRFITDQGIRDTRPPISSGKNSDFAAWDAMKAAWDSKIDYQRVYNILS